MKFASWSTHENGIRRKEDRDKNRVGGRCSSVNNMKAPALK
jgi:hypothetical protein